QPGHLYAVGGAHLGLGHGLLLRRSLLRRLRRRGHRHLRRGLRPVLRKPLLLQPGPLLREQRPLLRPRPLLRRHLPSRVTGVATMTSIASFRRSISRSPVSIGLLTLLFATGSLTCAPSRSGGGDPGRAEQPTTVVARALADLGTAPD